MCIRDSGIGTTNPLIPVGAGNTHILNVGVVTCNNIAAGSSITAGTFYGSGANLTSLPSQLTLSNNADNRVITGGSGTNLNGEANLTFDGNNLNQTIDNSGEGIRITAPNNHYSVLRFDSNVSSANGSLCNIQGHWNGNEVANIIFSAGSDTTNKDDGYIRVYTRESGQSNTERVRIESSGRVLIGTTTNRLGEKLHVLGDGIVTSSAENTNMMIFGTFGSSNAIIGSFNSIPLLFRTGNTERLRIGSSGEIGIAGANYGTSGQVLTSQGSGSAVQWATPSSGLSHAQQWYLTTNGNTASGNTDHVLPTDGGTWQKHSAAVGVSAGTLGSDMTYSGSGIFTFPVTGIWKIEFQGWWGIGASDSDHYLRSRIQTTVNNSSWATVQEQANSVKSDSTYTYQGFNVSYLFDVTSTSNCKVRFVLNPSGSNTYYKADGSPPKTGALFMRLGDT